MFRWTCALAGTVSLFHGRGVCEETLLNWSGTHEARVREIYTPASEEELQKLLGRFHREGRKVRVIGSCLSPNAIGFPDDGTDAISMENMDRVLNVDADRQLVTVQPGIRIRELVEKLKPFDLTLQNFASISEQQVGGFVQVSAHGTGLSIPPVDAQVRQFRIATPARGTLQMDNTDALFDLSCVGIGCLGVLSQVTLQCVPRHRLLEKTYTVSRDWLWSHPEEHRRLLRENRHVRYMWIPYTDTVVVVVCNVVEQEDELTCKERSFADQRTRMLSQGPLDVDLIRKINHAEASYWKQEESIRVGWSDEILGFECGGSQTVSEVAIPLPKDTHTDLQYMKELLERIESSNVPAPAPIEQRWTSCSPSAMSPASCDHGSKLEGFSWVGVIMYLPEKYRDQVLVQFDDYVKLLYPLWYKFDAREHWAKVSSTEYPLRFPLDSFHELRLEWDPNGILINSFLERILALEE